MYQKYWFIMSCDSYIITILKLLLFLLVLVMFLPSENNLKVLVGSYLYI